MKTLALVFAMSLFSAGAAFAQTTPTTSQTQPTKTKTAKPVKATPPAQATSPTPPAPAPITNISQSYADEAIAALKAINANIDIGDDADTRKAMSALEVDETKDQPATLDIFASLATLDTEAATIRIKNDSAEKDQEADQYA
jgi:hypothetical protein